jgi:hypothetical protein
MIPIEMAISEFAGSAAAVKTLFRELSAKDAAKTLALVMIDKSLGRPWNELPTPADTQESLSRRQIGPAVILNRRLREIVPPERARELMRRIVVAGAVDFLSRNVPVMNKNRILSMDEHERERFLKSIKEKFFNADADMIVEGDEALNMRVTRCRFVELLESIGEKDMAPVFCEGDKIFFDERQFEILLDRPKTLSHGDEICDFRFKWRG